MGTLCWVGKQKCKLNDYCRQLCNKKLQSGAVCSVLCMVLLQKMYILGQRLMIIDKCTTMWMATWTFITGNLFEPAKKGLTTLSCEVIPCAWCWGSCVCAGRCIGWPTWTSQEELNCCVEECCVLEVVRKNWTIVVLMGAEPAWANQEELDYCVVWWLWCSGWRGDSVTRGVCWTVVGSTLRSAVWSDRFVVQGK